MGESVRADRMGDDVYMAPRIYVHLLGDGRLSSALYLSSHTSVMRLLMANLGRVCSAQSVAPPVTSTRPRCVCPRTALVRRDTLHVIDVELIVYASMGCAPALRTDIVSTL